MHWHDTGRCYIARHPTKMDTCIHSHRTLKVLHSIRSAQLTNLKLLPSYNAEILSAVFLTQSFRLDFLYHSERIPGREELNEGLIDCTTTVFKSRLWS